MHCTLNRKYLVTPYKYLWHRTRCNLSLQSSSTCKHVLLRKNAKSLNAMTPLRFWSPLHTTIMKTKLNKLYGRLGLWYLSTALSDEEWHLWTHTSTQNKVCLTCVVPYTNWANVLTGVSLSKELERMRAAEIIHGHPITWWHELLGLIEMRDLCLWLKGKHFVLFLCTLQHCTYVWYTKTYEHRNSVILLGSIGKNYLWLKYPESIHNSQER